MFANIYLWCWIVFLVDVGNAFQIEKSGKKILMQIIMHFKREIILNKKIDILYAEFFWNLSQQLKWIGNLVWNIVKSNQTANIFKFTSVSTV